MEFSVNLFLFCLSTLYGPQSIFNCKDCEKIFPLQSTVMSKTSGQTAQHVKFKRFFLKLKVFEAVLGYYCICGYEILTVILVLASQMLEVAIFFPSKI